MQGLSRWRLPAAGRVALERSSLQGLQLPSCQCNQAAAGRSRRGGRLTVQAASTIGGKKVNKVVLAYSGGLDTSVILKWLQDTYDCEVVTFTADLGQVSMGRQPIDVLSADSGFWSASYFREACRGRLLTYSGGRPPWQVKGTCCSMRL